MDIAKTFKTECSQTVRMPPKLQFSATEVEINRDGDKTVLSPISSDKALEDFLAMPKCLDFEVDRSE